MNLRDYKKFQYLLYPVLIIAIAALIRIFPHLPNFTPIAAIALFGGAYLPKKYAIILPFAAMLISDFFIGFHNTMIFVYGAFLLIGLIGMRLKSRVGIKNVFTATILSSILFFLITNFGVWAVSSMYSKTFLGLMEAYFMGIPFLRNTMLGDAFYVVAFFCSFELVKRYVLNKNLLPQK